MAEEEKKQGRDYAGALVPLAVAAIVFAGAYYAYSSFIAPSDHVVNGILVVTHGDPKAALSAPFDSRNVTVQLAADNTTDRTLACEALAFAEASAGIASDSYNVTPQGLIAGGYCVDANQTVEPCRKASLLVQRGPCDCMRIDQASGEVIVEGSDSWLCAQAPQIRNTIAWALSNNSSA